MRITRPNNLRASAGFTLAESLMASVVLAVAAIGVVTTISASHMQAMATSSDAQAAALARQLMEEIAAKPLLGIGEDSSPGWPTETDRSHYDSVNDYSGYSDTTPLATLEGTTADATAAPFTRSVTFSYPPTLFGTAPAIGEFVVVVVSARDSAGREVTLRRLVARTNLQR